MISRRTFLHCAGLTGLSLTLFGGRKTAGAAEPYQGPLWVHVTAGGAWDTRMMFDPTLRLDQNHVYSSIESVGNIPYAPIPIDLADFGLPGGFGYETILLPAQTFLERYGARLTVVNGIDTGTVDHDTGLRAMGSGKLTIGYPSFPALIAAARAPEQLMAFVSGGGYDATRGLIPLTRVDRMDFLAQIAHPNQVLLGADDTYHTAATMARIREAQRERIGDLRARQNLPRIRAAMESLEFARKNDADLELFTPPPPVQLPGAALRDLERFMQQIQIAVTAFQTGLCVSANLLLGLFDSHFDNDLKQKNQITKLFAGLDFLIQQAGAAGIADRLYIVVTSDFGRTPYDSPEPSAGKHHWPTTTMFAMGPDIPGNRLIGATTDDNLPMNVDPSTLQPVATGGVTITPAVVNRALRRKAGIHEHAVSRGFELEGEDLPLFG